MEMRQASIKHSTEQARRSAAVHGYDKATRMHEKTQKYRTEDETVCILVEGEVGGVKRSNLAFRSIFVGKLFNCMLCVGV